MALESFLAFLSFPFFQYSIEPFSRSRERWLGADARLHAHVESFAPLYMQFKRPTAYDAESSASVIKDRKSLKLTVHPRSLYFALRDKQPQHHSYQHNILLKLSNRLRRRGLGDATYVCPLFLDRAAYRWNTYFAALGHRLRFWDEYPYHFSDLVMNHASGRLNLDRVPILAEHICIRPHCTVADAKHSYSFSEDGKDVCFHSPAALPDNGKPLSRWISGVWNTFAESAPQQRITGDNAIERLRDLVGPAGEDTAIEAIEVPSDVLETDNGIEAWQRFGEFLQEEHEIEQYAIVAWRRSQ